MSANENEQPATWREEFPIREGDERYVTRRQFARFLVLTSLAMFVGNLWILAKSWLGKARGPVEAAIPGAAGLPVGGSTVFDYPEPGEPCLLIRRSQDEFVAFSQKCTHLSCAVVPRPAEGSFYCPCHEGRFDLRTGAPTAGPPRRPLTRIILDVRGGDIYAIGVEERTI